MAGDTFSFSILEACRNPSSLWFTNESLEIVTRNSLGMDVEKRTSFLQLNKLLPAKMGKVELTFDD
jgi:hypothetical protein